MIKVLKVSVLNTHHDVFDYLSENTWPSIGTRVWVPFRNQKRLGVVMDEGTSNLTLKQLKSIHEVIDETPVLSKEMLRLCRWVGQYYQSPLSEVLPLMLPKHYRRGDALYKPCMVHYTLKEPLAVLKPQLKPNAHRQQALLAFLEHHPQISKKDILQAGFSWSLMQAFIQQGWIGIQETLVQPIVTQTQSKALALNPEQQTAVDTILLHINQYQCFYLYGVTGSGKTEVYLQVITKVLMQKKQVLVLVPEIGLTPQMMSRFKTRFSEPMAVIHSHLREEERVLAWQWASEGTVRLIIGTRAAIFTPMPDLGLIVVDEEHDASFKQMDGVRYSARDSALVRARGLNIPIIMGSATPSLESLHNGFNGKYQVLKLHNKAISQHPLHYQILDVRHQKLEQGLAPASLTLIEQHLSQDNQVLVFINRRGYAPVLMCHDCGWMADCRSCDSHMTLHRKKNQLLCHHCGQYNQAPTHCPKCHGASLLPLGLGTQRIFEYLQTRFPNTNILRMDRDEVQGKDVMDTKLAEIESGQIQMVVGTQMLAKGHHFPNLTLVVVLDADQGFFNQDFRAIERLGQLLTQVSGRAGRDTRPGQVVIQTHIPEHPLLNLLVQKGYDLFAQALLVQRQSTKMPPFYHLALIRAGSKKADKPLALLHAMKALLHKNSVLDILGPAPAPLARKAMQHRWQLLIKSPNRVTLNQELTSLRHEFLRHTLSQGVVWGIDVDPMDLA